MAEKKKTYGMSWDSAPTSSNNNKRYTDLIDIFPFSEEWTRLRIVGDVWQVKQHWLPTLKKSGGTTSFPRLCLKSADNNAKCPYCQAGLRQQVLFLCNAIIRDIQESKPESKKKLGVIPEGKEYREKSDTFWSPIKVVQFPMTVADKIKSYKALNKSKETGECYDINHKKYGRDLLISKNTSASGGGMYDVQREDRTPLDKEEKAYLHFDLDTIYECIEEYEEALETLESVYNKNLFDEENCNMKSLENLLGVSGKKSKNKDVDDDEDEEEYTPKSKKKSKKVEDDDDDIDMDDDDDIDLDDEDEDDEPKKKKKSKGSSKKVKDDLDDDDDNEDEDDEDDEEERPKNNKKKSKKVEDEDDEDLDDEDDEDDEPKSKSKSKKSKKKVEEDDDDDIDMDDDDDDDLDEDEDEPKSKKTKSKKSKKDEEDDDDLDDDIEDEDDDDLDEDEDEEDDDEPKKKGGKKGKK